MPVGADMSQPPETGTGVPVIGVTGLQTDMSGPAETEVVKEDTAEIAGTGRDPRTGIIGEGLTATEGMQTGCTDLLARKLRGRKQAPLILPAALFTLRLVKT